MQLQIVNSRPKNRYCFFFFFNINLGICFHAINLKLKAVTPHHSHKLQSFRYCNYITLVKLTYTHTQTRSKKRRPKKQMQGNCKNTDILTRENDAEKSTFITIALQPNMCSHTIKLLGLFFLGLVYFSFSFFVSVFATHFLSDINYYGHML